MKYITSLHFQNIFIWNAKVLNFSKTLTVVDTLCHGIGHNDFVYNKRITNKFSCVVMETFYGVYV